MWHPNQQHRGGGQHRGTNGSGAQVIALHILISNCREARAAERANANGTPQLQPRPCSRPMGAVQTLGGLRSGGMRELAVTSDGAGSIREVSNMQLRSATVGSGDNVWKHFARQAPILGQAFCGHSGHGLAGL